VGQHGKIRKVRSTPAVEATEHKKDREATCSETEVETCSFEGGNWYMVRPMTGIYTPAVSSDRGTPRALQKLTRVTFGMHNVPLREGVEVRVMKRRGGGGEKAGLESDFHEESEGGERRK